MFKRKLSEMASLEGLSGTRLKEQLIENFKLAGQAAKKRTLKRKEILKELSDGRLSLMKVRRAFISSSNFGDVISINNNNYEGVIEWLDKFIKNIKDKDLKKAMERLRDFIEIKTNSQKDNIIKHNDTLVGSGFTLKARNLLVLHDWSSLKIGDSGKVLKKYLRKNFFGELKLKRGKSVFKSIIEKIPEHNIKDASSIKSKINELCDALTSWPTPNDKLDSDTTKFFNDTSFINPFQGCFAQLVGNKCFGKVLTKIINIETLYNEGKEHLNNYSKQEKRKDLIDAFCEHYQYFLKIIFDGLGQKENSGVTQRYLGLGKPGKMLFKYVQDLYEQLKEKKDAAYTIQKLNKFKDLTEKLDFSEHLVDTCKDIKEPIIKFIDNIISALELTNKK